MENQDDEKKPEEIEGSPISSENKRRALWKEIWSWVKTIGGAFLFALFMNQVIIVNAEVPSPSMENTIMTKDRIVAFRLAYTFSEPKRFDIVIFRYPDNEKKLYVKRVMGLPGETLEMRGGIVYITGKDGVETEIDDSMYIREKAWGNYGPVTIPDGMYFMMGDNRNNSEDSRLWKNTFVAKNKILGKVIFSYYPRIRTIK